MSDFAVYGRFLDESTTVTDEIKPFYKPPPRIPCESMGTGLNKHVYFVCNERKYYQKEIYQITFSSPSFNSVWKKITF